MEWDEINKNERLLLISHYNRLSKHYEDQISMTESELEQVRVKTRLLSSSAAFYNAAQSLIKLQLIKLGVRNGDSEKKDDHE